jgi:hypothetical protein
MLQPWGLSSRATTAGRSLRGDGTRAVLSDLRRDSEALPLCGPVQPSREFLRTLERKQLIVERVDADGTSHPLVLQGDTREGWRARGYIRDLLQP